MKKNNFLTKSFVISCLLISNFFYAQDSIIIWDEKRPLTWNDFKGEKYSVSHFTAEIGTNILILPSYSPQKDTNFLVIPVAYPYVSWSTKEKENDYGLRHEQLHFDIAKLYALKIEQSIKNIKSGTEKKKVIDSILNKFYSAQDYYDEQTANGLVHTRQKIWEIKIRDSLRKFGYYKRKIDTSKCRILKKGQFKYIIKNDLIDTIMARQYFIAKVNDSIQEIEYLDTGLKAVQKIKWISPCAFIAFDTKIVKKSNSPYFRNIEPGEEIVVEILKADGNRFIGEYVKGGFFFVPVEIIQLE